MTFHERAVLALFLVLVGLWFLRKPGFLGGWADLLQWEGRAGSKVTIGAASPTLAVVLLLFVVPADPRGQPGGPTLLQWGVVQTRLLSSSSPSSSPCTCSSPSSSYTSSYFSCSSSSYFYYYYSSSSSSSSLYFSVQYLGSLGALSY